MSAARQGKVMLAINGFNPDGSQRVIQQFLPTGDRWKIVLEPGFYLVQTQDGAAQALFQVPGKGGDDARL